MSLPCVDLSPHRAGAPRGCRSPDEQSKTSFRTPTTTSRRVDRTNSSSRCLCARAVFVGLLVADDGRTRVVRTAQTVACGSSAAWAGRRHGFACPVDNPQPTGPSILTQRESVHDRDDPVRLRRPPGRCRYRSACCRARTPLALPSANGAASNPGSRHRIVADENHPILPFFPPPTCHTGVEAGQFRRPTLGRFRPVGPSPPKRMQPDDVSVWSDNLWAGKRDTACSHARAAGVENGRRDRVGE